MHQEKVEMNPYLLFLFYCGVLIVHCTVLQMLFRIAIYSAKKAKRERMYVCKVLLVNE